MVLVDTSVWVAHLRQGAIGLEALLHGGRVLCHPFIVGELACGNLGNRSEIISHLQRLPGTIPAAHEEVMQFIEYYGLMGKGLGYIDMHLLASARLTRVPLWTLDKKLNDAVEKTGISPLIFSVWHWLFCLSPPLPFPVHRIDWIGLFT